MKSWFTGKRASRGVNTGTDWQQRGNYGPTIISHFSNKYFFFLKSTQVLATILCFSFCCCVFGGGFGAGSYCVATARLLDEQALIPLKVLQKKPPQHKHGPQGQFRDASLVRWRLGGIMAACVSHQRRTSGAEKWRHHGNNEKCFCDALKWGENSMQRLKQFLVADCKHVYICCKVLTWGFIEDWLTFEASSGH